ncbi:MAG TPA: STN domain-containing protein, partial [Steroidobacteraceae bacterium]
MLADALETFAKITGYQLVYRTEIAAGLKTQGAEAGLSAEDTLRQLLRGTGLTFAFVNDRTIAIYRASERKPYSGGEGARDVQPDSSIPDINDHGSGSVAGNVIGTGEKSVIHRGLLSRIAGGLSLALASIASGADVPQGGSGDASMNGRLDEIVVTAQKKSERMQDVPIP